MTRAKLSDHFTIEEFDCHDGTNVPGTARLALVEWARVWGEPLRRAYGPVRVTSGYRTRRYNASVGGAAASLHLYLLPRGGVDVRSAERGVAADVVPARGSVAAWEEWARRHRSATASLGRAGRGGIGVYPRSGFIHLDTGPARDWRG